MQIRGFAEGWAQGTIRAWQKELRKKGIGITDELYNSFAAEVKIQQEELVGVMFRFLYYGRLRDMNVGRGLKAYERSNNTANASGARRYGANVDFVNRRQKRWYNKPKMAQIYRLRELLSQRMSQTVSNSVTEIASSVAHLNIQING